MKILFAKPQKCKSTQSIWNLVLIVRATTRVHLGVAQYMNKKNLHRKSPRIALSISNLRCSFGCQIRAQTLCRIHNPDCFKILTRTTSPTRLTVSNNDALVSCGHICIDAKLHKELQFCTTLDSFRTRAPPPSNP